MCGLWCKICLVTSWLQFNLGNSKIFETFVGGHRGGMKECYHGPCDIYNHKEKHKNNIQWDFLVKTTQTLIGNSPETFHRLFFESMFYSLQML